MGRRVSGVCSETMSTASDHARRARPSRNCASSASSSCGGRPVAREIVDREPEGPRPRRHRAADPAHPDDPERLCRAGRRPSIQVGDQPGQSPSRGTTSAPSTSRRGSASISIIAMSAVSSVSTEGRVGDGEPRRIGALRCRYCRSRCRTGRSACSSLGRREISVGVEPVVDRGDQHILARRALDQGIERSSTPSTGLQVTSNSAAIRASICSGRRRVTKILGRLRVKLGSPFSDH